MAILTAADLPTLSLLYKLNKLLPPSSPPKLPPSKPLNDRISLIRHDITQLRVDAITNAANTRLLGGGGIDGAIHAAAGPALLAECRKLRGCATGDAKITAAYKLPCKHVIHAVGPVYDAYEPAESERLLAGVYEKVLRLAVQQGCRSVALCGISTGIYGYPPRDAAPVALKAVRGFLESEEGKELEMVVFVTWVKQDVDSYTEFLPIYFPPVVEEESTETKSAEEPIKGEPVANKTTETADDNKTEAAETKEAEEVASKLPDVPKSDPGDSEHVEKKRKTD